MGANIAIIFAGGSGARMGSGLPKQFIEVNLKNGGVTLVNVNTISFLSALNSGKVQIILTSPSSNGSHFIETSETYEEIKTKIQEAL